MRVLSILAHPRPDSFCHAIAERARVALSRRGHDVVSCDLYQENFDPILRAAESATSGLDAEAAFDEIVDDPIHDYRADLVRAEGLFVVHPNWWGKPPAILAGWIDRVFVPGVAYRIETGEGMPEGLLNLRAALILNTSNTPGEQEQAMLGDPLESMWTRCILPFCGVTNGSRTVFGPVASSTARQRTDWLASIDGLVDAHFGVFGSQE